jgi:hypothetical protein
VCSPSLFHIGSDAGAGLTCTGTNHAASELLAAANVGGAGAAVAREAVSTPIPAPIVAAAGAGDCTRLRTVALGLCNLFIKHGEPRKQPSL